MDNISSIKSLIKMLRKDATTQGITTATGLNFYNLEPQAKNIYPVFYPLLASIPRKNPTFNGMRVGGTGINWKAITAINAPYPAVSEGNRNAFMSFSERNFYAPFKFLGNETEVSFQAQDTGLGFDDNIAEAQLGLLNGLLNMEERMILFGNSGPNANGGAYGFALGTPATPTATAVATVTDSFGNTGPIAASTNVYVGVVALTAWGAYLATSIGVTLPFVRTNADASTDTINGGTSIYSALSSVSPTTSLNGTIKATIPAIAGAVAYAWYAGTTNATATTYFVGVTPYPTVLISALNNANQVMTATDPTSTKGLSTDNSYNNLDFDGMLTWGASWSKDATQPSYWKDYGGAGFTSNGDGTIAEFEAVLDYFWKTYKITFDEILVGGALITPISRAIVTSSTGSNAQRIIFDRDGDGSLRGGTKLVDYRSKYSNTGAPKVLPVYTHPWMPDGTVMFRIKGNPYPAAGASISNVWEVLSLEDHFSIKWPYRRLMHEIGTYCFETLTSKIPFANAVLTGFKAVVN